MRRRRTTLIGVLVVTGLLAAACGGNDKGSSSSGSNATSGGGSGAKCSTPGFSADSIKVGVIEQTTGNPLVVMDFKNAEAAVKARFGLENAKGGINGRKLVTTAADDGGDANKNLSAARKLVESDKVFGIVELTIQPGGAGDYLKSKDVPVTGWATASDPYALDDNFFGHNGSIAKDPQKEPTSVLTGFLKAKGVTTMGFFGGTDPGSVSVTNGDAEGAQLQGMKVGVKDTSIEFGTKNFTGQAAKMKSAGVDGVIPELDPTTNLALINAARQAGVNAQFLLTTGYDDRFLNFAKDALEGTYFLVPYAPFELDLPGHQTLKQAFQQYAPGTPINEASVISYLSADLFVKGLEVAPKCPSRSDYVKALRGVHDYDAGGLVPTVDEAKVLGKPPLCEWFVRAQGGKFVPQGDKPYCGKALKPSS